MTTELTVYTGMANESRLELVQDGSPVVASAITGAVLKFGVYCVDTEADPAHLYFLDSSHQTLCLRLGLITNIEAGLYRRGMLTLIEAGNLLPIAWVLLDIRVQPWQVCPVA